jgi:hypothetical protein
MKLKKNQLKKISKKNHVNLWTGDSSHEPWTNPIETEKKNQS